MLDESFYCTLDQENYYGKREHEGGEIQCKNFISTFPHLQQSCPMSE